MRSVWASISMEFSCAFCFKHDFHLYCSSVGGVIKCPLSACMWTVSLVVDLPLHGSSFKFESYCVCDFSNGKASSKTMNWAFFVLLNAPSALLVDVWALKTWFLSSWRSIKEISRAIPSAQRLWRSLIALVHGGIIQFRSYSLCKIWRRLALRTIKTFLE